MLLKVRAFFNQRCGQFVNSISYKRYSMSASPSREITLASLPPDIIRLIIPMTGQPYRAMLVSGRLILSFYIFLNDIIITDLENVECNGARVSK